MQDRYVGDIGDYAKYGLLRALSAGKKLGVAWYRYPDEMHNDDGMHIVYLCQPKVWQHLDPELFDALEDIINLWQTGVGQRTVAEIQNRNLLPGAVFADELLYADLRTPDWCRPELWRANRLAQFKRDWRAGWFSRVQAAVASCNIVFADPDNGVVLDEKYDESKQKHWKGIPVREVQELSSNGRTLIIYHQHGRNRKHNDDIQDWMGRLPGCTHAFYVRRNTCRTFFVVNPDQDIVAHLTNFVNAWRQAELRLGVKPDKLSELITRKDAL